MPGELETARLRLRPLTWEDLPFFVALHADERVAANLGHGKPRSAAETRDWLATILGWYQQGGPGHLAVLLKETETLVGRCGLSRMEVEAGQVDVDGEGRARAFWGRGSAPVGVTTTSVFEVGYTFHPDFWGRGLATEASRLMRDQAFTVWDQPRVISLIRADNAASIRVAAKNGFTDRGEVEFFGRRYLRYQLTRAEWNQSAKTR